MLSFGELDRRTNTLDSNASDLPFETVLERFPSRRLLVVGDLMLDRFSYGDVGRISPEAPAAVINLERVEEAVGGAGNVARNIDSLNAQCDLLSMVGTDDAANSICRCLAALPKIEAHLVHAPDRVTTVRVGLLQSCIIHISCARMLRIPRLFRMNSSRR